MLKPNHCLVPYTDKPLMLQKGEVHVWYAALRDLTPNLASLVALLSEAELARANQLRFEQDRVRFCFARGVLRSLLAMYCRTSPSKIAFTYNANGRPLLRASPEDLRFNVSHTHEIAVYAVTKGLPV